MNLSDIFMKYKQSISQNKSIYFGSNDPTNLKDESQKSQIKKKVKTVEKEIYKILTTHTYM